jgi:hypothetical protein
VVEVCPLPFARAGFESEVLVALDDERRAL